MPDGKSLAFVAIGDLDKNIYNIAVYSVQADGSTRATLLQRYKFGLWEAEMSRDGQWMVVRADEDGTINRIRARRMSGDTALIPIVADQKSALALDIALSPDGRWLAYTSDEGGQQVEVYVTSFPDARTRHLVSRGGGTEPRWSRDGRELFFESAGQLKVVDVSAGASFTPGNPRTLFSLLGYRRARNRQQYDVSPDGKRFVMIREGNRTTDRGVVYAENWFSELRAKVGR